MHSASRFDITSLTREREKRGEKLYALRNVNFSKTKSFFLILRLRKYLFLRKNLWTVRIWSANRFISVCKSVWNEEHCIIQCSSFHTDLLSSTGFLGQSNSRTFSFPYNNSPWQVPYFGSTFDDVLLAGGNHLIGDLDEQGGHPFRGVVVERHAVDHTYAVHQARDVLHHLQLNKKWDSTATKKLRSDVIPFSLTKFNKPFCKQCCILNFCLHSKTIQSKQQKQIIQWI